MRKIHGDVNPADLFTKHLLSKDKIHQLTSFFEYEYRDGRAKGAPLPRPHVADGQPGGPLPDDSVLPNFTIAET